MGIILTTKPLIIEYITKCFIELAQEVISNFRLVTHYSRNRVLAYTYTGREVFLILDSFHVFLYPSEGFGKDIIPLSHKSACIMLKYYNNPHQSAQI
jgi:hypothetical protein